MHQDPRTVSFARRTGKGAVGATIVPPLDEFLAEPDPGNAEVIVLHDQDPCIYSGEIRPSSVVQSVAFALPKTDCWEDLDRIPPGDNEIKMKGLGT